MKLHLISSPALAAALFLAPLAASAQNSTLQPINTRFAQTQSKISVELSAGYFTDLELEEADGFDGWTAALEIVVPLKIISERMQLRLSVPFYTDGDATITDPALPDVGDDIDIDGDGGVYDFVTLEFEHQLFTQERFGFNAAYTIGFGEVRESLDTTTSDKDLYNHEGKVTLGGIKFDRPVTIFDNKSQLLINAGFRYYYETDDLHPDDRDDWTWADLKGAIVFEQWGYVVPVVELTYLGDFGHYNEILLHPEVIVPFNDHVSIKIGGIISLSADGNQGGAAASLSVGF